MIDNQHRRMMEFTSSHQANLLVFTFVVVLSLGLAATATAQTGKEVVVGKWVLDAKRTEKLGNKESAEALKYLGRMTIEFKANGKMVAIANPGGDEDVSEGTWKVVKDVPQGMLFEFKESKESNPEKILVGFLDGGDYMRLEPDPDKEDDQTVLVFRREKKK